MTGVYLLKMSCDMPLKYTYDNWTFFQMISWCHKAASHDMPKWWLMIHTPCGGIRYSRVNHSWENFASVTFKITLYRYAHKDRNMMTSPNGNIFRVTGTLFGEFIGHRWILLTKGTDAEFWCFVWSAPEQTVEQTTEAPGIWDANVLSMTPL